ncbi:RagB/SusD family nutrient uptake outer membrane protein [Chitinophaga sp. XS-30]|uniref:RagB/SusD family nutrient uptake outer membrane protein n=1 Tax=Chitinophaga sp. XS-30 TaxID=2604421 RepID=UPI0011DE3034|nr:RagB/SusD family nutrient uptake outer membrane protein [Chitinophaga sp. XS-30]QEH43425.1 RagB/SusD family nutrient uptake outer membrane protein [Chitinophaga sp. XS-30]
MNIRIYILAIAAVVFAFSCRKYETYPVERITDNIVYDSLDKNGTYAEWVVNGIYAFLPNGYNRIDNVVLDAATDDAVASGYGNDIEVLGKSRLTAVNNPDDKWAFSYEAIRRANLFLAKVDVVPRDETTKAYWKAEVRFIRAMSYFELVRRYGGVPLLGSRYFSLEEPIRLTRNTFDEVVAYIVQECDAIFPSLRSDPIDNTNLGRITQAAALALKSRVLLLAASPLNNPADDRARWLAAATAARDVISLGKYSLAANFNGIFTNRKSPEVILAYQAVQHSNLERQNAPIGYVEPNVSQGYVSPTQQLVDAFPMLNGSAITDAGAGYDPANPYANRDPRLSATVFYNGMMWLGRAVETFEGGLDNPAAEVRVSRRTRTGYYLRKFLGNFGTASDYSNQDHNFPIFRYAEILLNYAEAANETDDRDAAYTQLMSIRRRAGLEEGADGLYGLKANMNKMEMREAIRLERRLELAFEEHRYWDLRRWKVAEQMLNKQVSGVRITRNADGTFTYGYQQVDYVSFAAKQYLYPIPYQEVTASGGMIKQNTGW